MHQLYLSRRNLLVLIHKLDRVKAGEQSFCTIVKQDTAHPEFPCSAEILVTALEDEDYYADRQPGRMHPSDEL